VLALLALVASIAEMGRRIARDNRENPRNYPVFQRIQTRSFAFAGRNVFIEDSRVDREFYLTIRYGEESLKLHVAIPPRYPGLPELASYDDFLRVLRFAETSGQSETQTADAIRRGMTPDRLVLVTKSPRAGADPQTWGEVWKRDWEFDFHELLPDGTIAHQRLGYPTIRPGQSPKPGELHEGTWQYFAALHLMPRVGPTLRFTRSPLAAAGWTLPAAALSSLVLLSSIVVAARPAGWRRAPGSVPGPDATPSGSISAS
jgi:hypothetical protein